MVYEATPLLVTHMICTYDVEETSAYTTRLHTVDQKSYRQVLGCFRCLHLVSATVESPILPRPEGPRRPEPGEA